MKSKHDARNESISLNTIQKICEANKIYIKVRGDRETRDITHCGNKDTALYKSDICRNGEHYFKYIENTYITTYFLRIHKELAGKLDGHVYYKKLSGQKTDFLTVKI